ncbi:MAG: hypothetical protein MUE97_06565 [Phycisphaerales bacterium]|nr:hypothetical protein [Phycisphaerales bacterium]
MSRISSPGRSKWHLWLPVITSVLAAFAAVVAGIVAVVKTTTEARDQPHLSILAWLVVAGLLAILSREGLQIYASFNAAQSAEKRLIRRDIQAVCQVVRDQLAERFADDVMLLEESRRPSAFRACVYRLSDAPRSDGPRDLERVTQYCVGAGGNPGDVGKRVSSACGVIGLAYRTGEVQVASRKSDDREAFLKEMIEEWGFSPEEAPTLNDTRWSFLAIPLKSQTVVDAVIFVDSEIKNCFDDKVVETFVLPAAASMTIILDGRNDYVA